MRPSGAATSCSRNSRPPTRADGLRAVIRAPPACAPIAARRAGRVFVLHGNASSRSAAMALLAPQGVVIGVFFFWPACAGAAAVAAADRRLRRLHRVGRAGQLPGALERPELPRVVPDDRGVLGAGRRARASACRCCSRSSPTASCAAPRSTRRCSSGPMRSRPPWQACYGSSCSRPASASSRTGCTRSGFEWNHLLNSRAGDGADRDGGGVEADLLQLPVLPRGPASIPKSLIEAAAIDGARPWRRFWSIQFPLLSPTTFFLLVINVVYAFFDTFAHRRCGDAGRPRQGHRDPRLQGGTTTASRRSISAARRRSRWC